MSKIVKIFLSIKGGGLQYKSTINADVASKVMALCLAGDDVQPTTSVDLKDKCREPDSTVKGVKYAPAEYIHHYGPKRNPDKILAFASYIREVEGRNSFNPGEIKRLFRDAGEVLPANFGRDFGWAKKCGWIAPDTDIKGNYYLTSTGQKVIQGGFPDELVKISKNKANGRRKKMKSK